MIVAMANALLDSNLLLDSYLQRQPWNVEADQILDAHFNFEFTGYVSASSLTDVYYILRKQLGAVDALNIVKEIVDNFAICAVDRGLLSKAASMPGSDFEDNLQIACAMHYGLAAIVTRDATGFKHSPILVLSPADFLAQYKLP